MPAGYVNAYLHDGALHLDALDDAAIADLGDALAERWGLGDDAVIPELLALPKELALAVLAHMVLRTVGFQHGTTRLLRDVLTRKALAS